MNLLAQLDDLYHEARRNRRLRYFAVFCRFALALGFIPSGIVKVIGERFTALPSNHPLGHYFDALHLTGFYYTFIGVSQLTAALLLLVPRTALMGAILYLPIILTICVNSQLECTNGCADNAHPEACERFCNCIYNEGSLLDKCLEEYGKRKGSADGLHRRIAR